VLLLGSVLQDAQVRGDILAGFAVLEIKGNSINLAKTGMSGCQA
jgi:hypothetical protein